MKTIKLFGNELPNNVRLTQKEISRCDNGYTAVVRPNCSGGWNVAVVDITDGNPVFKFSHCENKNEISRIIKDDLRMMDKCGFKCKMASKSRHRK